MKVLLALALGFFLPVAAATAEPASYQDNCKIFLALIDAGKYDETWDVASDFFKSKLTREQAGALIKAGRATVGDLVSRGPAQVTQTSTLPDMPFGRYLVIVIQTKFALKANATETIIMKLENSEWKVAGYFIT